MSSTKKIIFVILIIVLMGIVCAGLLYFNVNAFNSPSSQNDDEPIVKTLGDFRSIDGTDFLIASVTASNYDGNILNELFSSGRWYGSSYGYNQYNLVFLDINTEEIYPLLENNESEIVSMEGFPKPVSSFNNQYEPQQTTPPIAWWLFSIAKSDTNMDNELSVLDKKTLSVSDVGGRGYTEIITDVDDLLGTAYKNNDTLLIIYRSNNISYLARIDLPSRQISSTEELPLGEDIQ